MSNKILITGATGFIGRRLVFALSNLKFRLRCLVRNRSEIGFLKDINCELVYGDITDSKSIQKAMKGITKVIHLAALVGSMDKKQNERVNIKGTKNVVDACLSENVKQIVVMSSISAKFGKGIYGKSKRAAEKLVVGSSLNYTILRPGLVFGKEGKQYHSFIKSIKDFPIIPLIDGGKNKIQPVDVDDLIQIIIKIINKEKSDRNIYEVGGATRLTTKELLTILCNRLHINKLKLSIPSFLMILAATILRKVSPINADQIRFMTFNSTANIEPLEKEYSVRFNNIQEILKKCGI